MTDRLLDVTYKAISYGLWDQPMLTRLLDGAVTRHDLQRASKSVDEHAKLAAMTKKGASNSEHTFEALRFGFSCPRPYEVTVDGKEVRAHYSGTMGDQKLTMARPQARQAALQGVAIATELRNAIRDQLLLQSGARTALEELKDSAEDAAILAAREAKKLKRQVEEAIAPGVRVAQEKLGDAERELRNVAEELGNVPDKLREVAGELGNVPDKLREAAEELRNVPGQLRDVAEELRRRFGR